jgi:hypothetical protein
MSIQLRTTIVFVTTTGQRIYATSTGFWIPPVTGEHGSKNPILYGTGDTVVLHHSIGRLQIANTGIVGGSMYLVV